MSLESLFDELICSDKIQQVNKTFLFIHSGDTLTMCMIHALDEPAGSLVIAICFAQNKSTVKFSRHFFIE